MAQKRNGTPVTLDAEATFHEACASPARLRMLLALYGTEGGELPVGTLSGLAGASTSAASQHLGRLRDRGIVLRRREGQQQFYSLAPAYREAVAQVAARVGGGR